MADYRNIELRIDYLQKALESARAVTRGDVATRLTVEQHVKIESLKACIRELYAALHQLTGESRVVGRGVRYGAVQNF